MNWSLQDISAALPSAVVQAGDAPAPSVPVRRVVIDSRKVEARDLFVAIQGERFDGHQFLAEVFARGAAAAVVSEQWWRATGQADAPRPLIVVPDPVAALQDLARTYRRKVAPQVIGLTGTNGKTTTKELVANILAMRYRTHKTSGNLNNHLGVPLTLLAMPEKTEVAVIELGMNHAKEIENLCRIAGPDYGLITNIGHGHVEFLGGLDGVRRAKQELFEAVAREGIACVNADDPHVVRAAKEAHVRQSKTYGFSAGALFQASNLRLGADGCARFDFEGETLACSVPGLHNAGNALAAVVLGRLLGVETGLIRQALRKPISVAGRMCLVEMDGKTLIDDAYNANPDSMRAALDFLAQFPTPGQRIAVLGDMLELGRNTVAEHRAVLAYALAQKVDRLLLCGSHMREAQTAGGLRHKRLRYFEDKASLASFLHEISAPGDLILIKGSRGSRMEEVQQALERFSAQGTDSHSSESA